MAKKTVAKANPKPKKLPAKAPKQEVDLQGEERFQTAVGKLQKRLSEMQSKALSIHWDIGFLFNKIKDDKAHYGGHTAKDLGDSLELSQDTIWACGRFNAIYDREGLKRLRERNMAWRNVFLLCSAAEKKRRKLEDNLHAGKFKSSDEFTLAVKESNREARSGEDGTPKKSTRGAPTFKRCAARIQALVTEVDRPYLEVKRMFSDLEGESPATKTKAKSNFKELVPIIKKSIKKLSELISLVE